MQFIEAVKGGGSSPFPSRKGGREGGDYVHPDRLKEGEGIPRWSFCSGVKGGLGAPFLKFPVKG